MAIWKEIRKAINSTVGTKGFKPLDKIIRDSYYVYASDDLLKTLYELSRPQTSLHEDIPVTNIGTMGVFGVVRIQIEATGGANLDEIYCVGIGKNGVVESILFPEGSGGVVTVDLEVSKNDVIQFSVDGSQQLFSGLTGLKITAHGTIGSAPDTGIFIE